MKITLIGKIISQLRCEHQLSIEELSQRSGVSQEKLEEIEAGNITPSIGVMVKISRALGARLGTLLDGQENLGAVITRKEDSLVSGDVLSSSGSGDRTAHMNFFSLAQGKKDRAMEPMIVELSSSGEAETLSEHEGEEFIYVISGVVEVIYGEQTHTLSAGDTIYYDSIVPHFVGSVSKEGAKILAVIYTPY